MLLIGFLLREFKNHKNQKAVILFLEKEGVECYKTYPEWLSAFPESVKGYFAYNLDIYLNSDLLINSSDSENIFIKKEVIEKLSELKHVREVQFWSGGFFFSIDTKIEKATILLFKSFAAYDGLETLQYSSDFVSENQLGELSKIKSLKRLEIESSEVPKNIFQNLSSLSNLKFLKIDTPSRFYEGDLQYLSKLASLEILLLGVDETKQDNYDSGYQCFPEVGSLIPSLKKLKYLGTSIDLQKFDFSKFPSLLWFHNSNLTADAKTLHKLGNFFNRDPKQLIEFLKKNELSSVELTVGYDVSDNEIKDLNKLTFLKSLIFQNPDLDFAKVEWEKFTNLQHLEFPLGISLVELLPQLKKVKKLNFLKGAGSDFTYEHFSELKKSCTEIDSFYHIDSRKDEKKYDSNNIEFLTDFLGNDFFTVEDLKLNEDKSLTQIQLKVDKLTPEMVAALDEYKSLNDLFVECNAGIESLNAMQDKDRLSTLTMSFKKMPEMPLEKFSKMETLSIFLEFETGHLSKLFSSKSFPVLNGLNIQNYRGGILNISNLDNLNNLKNLQLLFGYFFTSKIIKLENLETLTVLGRSNIENIKTGENFLNINTNNLEVYTSDQIKKLINLDSGLEYLDLTKVIDPENIVIHDLAKFQNLQYLKLPPLNKDKSEIINLVNSLPKFKYLVIRNTGLRRDDFSKAILEEIDIQYD